MRNITFSKTSPMSDYIRLKMFNLRTMAISIVKPGLSAMIIITACIMISFSQVVNFKISFIQKNIWVVSKVHSKIKTRVKKYVIVGKT